MSSAAPPEPAYRPPGPDQVRLVHIDETLIVADKPAGLLSVPGRSIEKQASLLTYLQAGYPEVEAVHRLDMDTSGLIVFARGKQAAGTLGNAFLTQAVTKTYHALVRGHPSEEGGRIELPIGRDWHMRPLRCIDRQTGRPACTDWWLEQRRGPDSLLRLKPRTGRTHQLRLHLSAIGHPILGDRFYGTAATANRLCLHATQLQFKHPLSKTLLTFSSLHPFS